MHDLVSAVPVRQIEDQRLEARVAFERSDTVRARAVPLPGEQRPLVEADQVAALRERGLPEPSGDRDAGALEIRADRVRLAGSALFPRPQQDCAVVRDQDRVVDIDRVGIARIRRLGEHDLGTRAGEQLAQGIVLARDVSGVGRGAPAVLAPEAEVLSTRRPDQHAAQRRRHVAQSVGPLSSRAHEASLLPCSVREPLGTVPGFAGDGFERISHAVSSFKSSWCRRSRRRT